MDRTSPLNRDDLDGIDYVRALRDGLIPLSPMAKNMGWRITEVDEGRARFLIELSRHLFNNLTLHGGAMATIADGVMSAAVNTKLPRGARARTVNLNVSFLSAPREDDGPLSATGLLIEMRRTLAFAQARIEDSSGRICCHAVASFTVQRPG